MNLLDFTNEQGFPFTESTVKFMQSMMLQLQYGSLLGGNNYILQGCAVNSGVVSNGWVVVNGEVLPFQGGAVQAYVIVADIPQQREFFGGAQNNYYHVRTAVFGNATAQYAWASFTRNDPANGVLARLDKVEKMLKPLLGYTATVGGVGTAVYGSWLFWGRPASEIPAGWEAVPDADWKGRVPVALDATDADFDTVGKTGGAKQLSLTDQQIMHRHSINTEQNGTDGTDAGVMFDDSDTGNFSENNPGPAAYTNYVGNSSQVRADVSRLQPYKVVMFIRFVG